MLKDTCNISSFQLDKDFLKLYKSSAIGMNLGRHHVNGCHGSEYMCHAKESWLLIGYLFIIKNICIYPVVITKNNKWYNSSVI